MSPFGWKLAVEIKVNYITNQSMCHLLNALCLYPGVSTVDKSMGSKLVFLLTGCVTLDKLVNNNDKIT